MCEGKFGTGNRGGSLVEREVLPERMIVESSGTAPDGRRGRRCVEDMMGGDWGNHGVLQGRCSREQRKRGWRWRGLRHGGPAAAA